LQSEQVKKTMIKINSASSSSSRLSGEPLDNVRNSKNAKEKKRFFKLNLISRDSRLCLG
jgi:hypothetical protein